MTIILIFIITLIMIKVNTFWNQNVNIGNLKIFWFSLTLILQRLRLYNISIFFLILIIFPFICLTALFQSFLLILWNWVIFLHFEIFFSSRKCHEFLIILGRWMVHPYIVWCIESIWKLTTTKNMIQR